MTVPGWVYKRHAYGDISREELYELEKFAESISRTGALGAQAAVADKSNNLHKVMKNVPQEDRDDVLRALRQMKKQAAHCVSPAKPSKSKKRLKAMAKQAGYKVTIDGKTYEGDDFDADQKKIFAKAYEPPKKPKKKKGKVLKVKNKKTLKRVGQAGLVGLGATAAGLAYKKSKSQEKQAGLRKFIGDVTGSTARKASKAAREAASESAKASKKLKQNKELAKAKEIEAYKHYEEYDRRKGKINKFIKATGGKRRPSRTQIEMAPDLDSDKMRQAYSDYQRAGAETVRAHKATKGLDTAARSSAKASSMASKRLQKAEAARSKARKQTAVGVAGAGAVGLGTAAALKGQKKEAALSGGQLATLMGGAALAPVASHLAMRGIDRMMQKSPAQVQQDLKKILQVHPDIGRPEDPRVQMAYASLMKLNPSYAEDPLIAGPLLKQIVDSRMNVADPNSASYVDPHMAKTLSEARKAVNTGGPGYSLGSEMGRSLSGGIQQAGKMGIDF